jgi:hypothetical protein
MTPVRVLLDAVCEGNDVGTAATLAGMDPAAVDHWLTLGRGWRGSHQRLGPYRRTLSDFASAVARAEAEVDKRLVASIMSAACSGSPTAWRAAAWLLRWRPPTVPAPSPQVDDGDAELIARLSTPVAAEPLDTFDD